MNKCDVYAIRKRLSKTAINKRSKEQRKIVYDKEKIDKKVRHVFSEIEYYIFCKALRGNNDREVHSTVQTHQKKLKALTKNCVLPFNSKEVSTNISSHILADSEKEALQFRLSYSIIPSGY